ncbi:hypothetical protein QFC19_007749 [Naganishia cerealis]|uniref:Uncharacterized protein n=1 Tax=Naganishia cerealis TaxID=610337 RepID=A0ACC2V739_9TREE|nr:hypothetical protein QFC19_007749 [Naganishia cerealis]
MNRSPAKRDRTLEQSRGEERYLNRTGRENDERALELDNTFETDALERARRRIAAWPKRHRMTRTTENDTKVDTTQHSRSWNTQDSLPPITIPDEKPEHFSLGYEVDNQRSNTLDASRSAVNLSTRALDDTSALAPNESSPSSSAFRRRFTQIQNESPGPGSWTREQSGDGRSRVHRRDGRAVLDGRDAAQEEKMAGAPRLFGEKALDSNGESRVDISPPPPPPPPPSYRLDRSEKRDEQSTGLKTAVTDDNGTRSRIAFSRQSDTQNSSIHNSRNHDSTSSLQYHVPPTQDASRAAPPTPVSTLHANGFPPTTTAGEPSNARRPSPTAEIDMSFSHVEHSTPLRSAPVPPMSSSRGGAVTGTGVRALLGLSSEEDDTVDTESVQLRGDAERQEKVASPCTATVPSGVAQRETTSSRTSFVRSPLSRQTNRSASQEEQRAGRGAPPISGKASRDEAAPRRTPDSKDRGGGVGGPGSPRWRETPVTREDTGLVEALSSVDGAVFDEEGDEPPPTHFATPESAIYTAEEAPLVLGTPQSPSRNSTPPEPTGINPVNTAAAASPQARRLARAVTQEVMAWYEQEVVRAQEQQVATRAREEAEAVLRQRVRSRGTVEGEREREKRRASGARWWWVAYMALMLISSALRSKGRQSGGELLVASTPVVFCCRDIPGSKHDGPQHPPRSPARRGPRIRVSAPPASARAGPGQPGPETEQNAHETRPPRSSSAPHLPHPAADHVLRCAAARDTPGKPLLPRRRADVCLGSEQDELVEDDLTPLERRAWREKLMVVMAALLLGAVTAFFTIGLNRVLCPGGESRVQAMTRPLGSGGQTLGIKGFEFNVSSAKPQPGVDFSALATQLSGQDVTSLFDRRSRVSPACQGLETDGAYASSSLCGSNQTIRYCVLPPLEDTTFQTLAITNTSRYVGYSWDQVAHLPEYLVLNGLVLDFGPYLAANPEEITGDAVDAVIRHVLFRAKEPKVVVGGKDATRLFYNTPRTMRAVRCVSDRYLVGRIDKVSPGCFFASILMYVVLVIILGIIVIKFLMALVFSWWLAPRMCRQVKSVQGEVAGLHIAWGRDSGAATAVSRGAGVNDDEPRTNRKPGALVSSSQIGPELFTLCLVTCYSESRTEIQGTLDSIAHTTYSSSRKLLFVVCDGIVKGHGETQTTPEICVALLERDKRFGRGEPEPRGYIAVGTGARRENAARVYAGHYRSTKGHTVPMLVIVKCGSAAERESSTTSSFGSAAGGSQGKPGNRGKRDSQMILMNFIMRVNYNERFTPLDFDLFRKVYALVGVSPDLFEAVLMVSPGLLCVIIANEDPAEHCQLVQVDADTRIYPDSLTTLVNCLHNDPAIMGICGETGIANKGTSWITAIQVFEYYVSHHLAKAFESVFGGVTCLPGCFSMYRLKARKGDGGDDWVPILAQPSVCQTYSQSEVSTLHEKSLLELGESANGFGKGSVRTG